MKIKHLLNISFFILLLHSLQGFSQNLVRNWSFEDTISCPTSSMQINKARHWFTPRGGGGSSDLFSTCHHWNPPYSGNVSVPKNLIGYQFPKLGNNYSGIVNHFNNSEAREYIETKLSQGLNPTINYYVEFWVSLSNESNYAIENIGAYFSTDTLHYSSNITTLIDAQVEHSGGIITDTLNWVKVSGYFKPPKDGYQFLTIGNFQPSDSTNKVLVGWNSYDGAYYYIENVVVIDSALQHTIGINNPQIETVKVKVYPNPANENVNIDITGQTKGNIYIQILNVDGQTVKSKSVLSNKNINIDTRNMHSGVYFIKVFDCQNLLGVEKLIIQR